MRVLTLLFLLTGICCAAELHPELEPLAIKFKADTDAIEGNRSPAAARLAQSYISALDGAEKTAIASGNVKQLAAINAERDHLRKNDLRPSADLPKNLLVARKAYLTSLARLDNETATRKQRVVADYIRALAALQSRAAGKPELMAQIAAEKDRVIRGAPVAASEAAMRLGGTKWKHSSGGTLTLNANGKIKASWGLEGTWRLVSATEFQLQWDGKKPEAWGIDLAAGELKTPGAGATYKRE